MMANKRKKPKDMTFAGYHFTGEAGEAGRPQRVMIDANRSGDYGADPLGDGTFRMVPSGDIVSFDERNRRLANKNPLSDWTGQIMLAGALVFAGLFYWQVNKKTD
jgi:hypothetical protein